MRADADLEQAVAQRDETKMLLSRLTIRAPRAGTVLQVNVRAGEYATPGATDPLILLGDTQELPVRADVDEVNAPLVKPGAAGVAYPKGSTMQAIPFRLRGSNPMSCRRSRLRATIPNAWTRACCRSSTDSSLRLFRSIRASKWMCSSSETVRDGSRMIQTRVGSPRKLVACGTYFPT